MFKIPEKWEDLAAWNIFFHHSILHKLQVPYLSVFWGVFSLVMEKYFSLGRCRSVCPPSFF